MRISTTLLALSLLAAVFSTPALAAVSFTGLGDLLGGSFQSEAKGVSGDGSVVVGTSSTDSGNRAFLWTSAGGIVENASGSGSRVAYDTSTDGSVVVGAFISESGSHAYRWTSEGGLVGITPGGVSFSNAHGVSADGSVVVGGFTPSSLIQAYRWTSEGGMIGLGDLPGGADASVANRVSADGSVVVGDSHGTSGTWEAFRWTSAGGMEGISGGVASIANDVSADGSIVIGRNSSSNEAFRWSITEGMVSLGLLPGGAFASNATGVSADGSVVVGWGHTTSTEFEPFFWTSNSGMVKLFDFLAMGGSNEAVGWTKNRAVDVSDDGRTIVGFGTNPSGQTEAWIAIIPEPSTALLLGMGLVALTASRRRSRTRAA